MALTKSICYAYIPVLPQKRSAYTRKHQAKQPCLGIEGAAENDGCSSSARMDNIGDKSSTDSLNDSDSDSSSSSEDVNAQRWVFCLLMDRSMHVLL